MGNLGAFCMLGWFYVVREAILYVLRAQRGNLVLMVLCSICRSVTNDLGVFNKSREDLYSKLV